MKLIRLILRRKRLLIVSGVVGLLMLVSLRVYSMASARGHIYTVDAVPERPVAIIFGAGVRPNGKPSPILADRIKTGVKLYQAGKVKALLLTGDNSVATYNEPEVMRQYALSLGVPDSALVLDYAGFRTYDSCYRARDIFKVDEAILVTQAFHLDRALLTCSGLGIDSVGVDASAARPEGYTQSNRLMYELRELPSTAFAVLDLLIGRKPTFLGDPLPIFTE
jgi:SanA protein